MSTLHPFIAHFVLFITSVFTTNLYAITPQDSSLQATIYEQDQQLFDAFNQCEDPSQLDKYAAYFTEDIEFYHDNGGVIWSRDAMIKNTKQYVCSNFTRKLEESSFNVYPIKNYGAISVGTHHFCQSESNKCQGQADFVMIWTNTDGKSHAR